MLYAVFVFAVRFIIYHLCLVNILSTKINATNSSVTTSMAQRTVGNKQGWVRKRFLSFMGVVDEDDDTDDNRAELQDEGEGSDARRYSLTCSMCHVENPTIPYIASCGHCYCYLCLRMAVTDDLSFQCVDCGRTIMTSGRPKLVSKKSSS